MGAFYFYYHLLIFLIVIKQIQLLIKCHFNKIYKQIGELHLR